MLRSSITESRRPNLPVNLVETILHALSTVFPYHNVVVMRISTYLWALATCAGFINSHDMNPISKTIDDISSQIEVLTQTVDGFQGGLSGTADALRILSQSDDLNKKIGDATKLANNSPDLNGEESAAIAYSVVHLSVKTFDVLDSLVDKKPQFDKAILGIGSGSFLVRDNLKKLKASAQGFGDALTPKLVKEVGDLAPYLLSTITFRFDQALKVYK